MVAARDSVFWNLNEWTERPYNINELLLTVEEGVAVETVSAATLAQVSNFTRLDEAEVLRKTLKTDPMALGLRSVTFFGYILTTVLSLVGFATYFYMNARQRSGHYAILRAIGLSSRQLYGTLALEQVILILAGLALGTVLGVILNQITLPGLPITLGDRAPVPPFVARNDWLAIAQIYANLAIAFLLVLGVATWQLWRTKLHRALRIGEE